MKTDKHTRPTLDFDLGVRVVAVPSGLKVMASASPMGEGMRLTIT